MFTAPTTGFLTSFTLTLNSPIGGVYGGVGTWNGGSTFATGYGSPTNLYLSGNVPSTGGPQDFMFTPNVAVTAGQQYVAYLSVYGDPSTTLGSSTRVPTVNPDTVTGIDYFVYNLNTNPVGNTAWDYDSFYGNLEFTAQFSLNPATIPEPSTVDLSMITLAALAGCAWRRRLSVGRETV